MLKQLKKAAIRQFLDRYKQQKLRNSNTTLAHSLATSRAMLEQAKYCFLITHGENDRCSTRLVQPIVDLDEMIVWIGTHPGLRKVAEIKNNAHVTLAFENTKEDASLVLYGTAQIETSSAKRKRYWKYEWRLFFPNGPESDDYVVIRIEPSTMELMNFKRNVVQEPFGLSPVILERTNDKWDIVKGAVL